MIDIKVPKQIYLMLGLILITFLSVIIFGCSSVSTTALTQIDGKHIAYYRSGNKGPTIIFQSGLGDGKNSWSSIIDVMDSTQAVFAYDRPGYDESDETDTSRDPCTIAKELHTLLQIVGVAPPFLLVGHSIGGLYQYVFAILYPEDVAGLLLLDPTHPQHWKRMQEEAPGMASKIRLLKATIFSSSSRQEFDDQEKCMDDLGARLPINCKIRMFTRTQFDLAELGPFENMTHSLETEWEKLLGVKKEQISDAGHYIHKDKPEVVISAINEIITDINKQKSGTTNR